MADNIRKPIPKNQRQLSIQQQDPLLENPNSAVTPLPQFVNPNTPPQNNAYRAQQISARNDTTRPFTIGIQDIDESINYYFENVIRPQVYQNGAMIDIPIIYGNPERWKAVQKDGYYRDKNAKIMAPLIMFRRTGMEKNRSIGNKLDANNPINYAVAAVGYQKGDTYSNFDILNNRKPVESYKVVVIPDYVTLTYDCIIWTYYVEQMNKIVESINYASDSYWGDPARFKFLARIDSFTNNETLNQGEERLIKTNFTVKLNGYIVPDTINKDLSTANKFFSKGKVTVSTELEITPAAPLRSSGASGAAVPPSPSFDADYQSVLDYATTQDYTLPSAGQQVLQNQLLVDLKDAGVWSKLDTFAVFATDGNSDFALIDWKRLSQYTAVNSPTFTTNGGFTGNGTSAYVNTNFNPSTSGVNYTLNDAGRFYWVDNRLGTVWEGILSANQNDSRNAISTTLRINGGNLNISTPFAIDGFHALNRTSLTNAELFTNTTQYSRTSTSTFIANENQFILRSGGIYNASRFRMYAMGGNLTAENTDFYNALNTYITSL
jgi:hypothetical protein